MKLVIWGFLPGKNPWKIEQWRCPEPNRVARPLCLFSLALRWVRCASCLAFSNIFETFSRTCQSNYRLQDKPVKEFARLFCVVLLLQKRFIVLIAKSKYKYSKCFPMQTMPPIQEYADLLFMCKMLFLHTTKRKKKKRLWTCQSKDKIDLLRRWRKIVHWRKRTKYQLLNCFLAK